MSHREGGGHAELNTRSAFRERDRPEQNAPSASARLRRRVAGGAAGRGGAGRGEQVLSVKDDDDDVVGLEREWEVDDLRGEVAEVDAIRKQQRTITHPCTFYGRTGGEGVDAAVFSYGLSPLGGCGVFNVVSLGSVRLPQHEEDRSIMSFLCRAYETEEAAQENAYDEDVILIEDPETGVFFSPLPVRAQMVNCAALELDVNGEPLVGDDGLFMSPDANCKLEFHEGRPVLVQTRELNLNDELLYLYRVEPAVDENGKKLIQDMIRWTKNRLNAARANQETPASHCSNYTSV